MDPMANLLVYGFLWLSYPCYHVKFFCLKKFIREGFDLNPCKNIPKTWRLGYVSSLEGNYIRIYIYILVYCYMGWNHRASHPFLRQVVNLEDETIETCESLRMLQHRNWGFSQPLVLFAGIWCVF